MVDGFDAEAIVDIFDRPQLGWLLLMPGSIEPVVALLKSRARRPKGIRAIGAMADLVPKADYRTDRVDWRAHLNSFGATELALHPRPPR